VPFYLRKNDEISQINYFTKLSKENTYEVRSLVEEYVKEKKVDYIVIASTTGFTAKCFESVIRNSGLSTFICKQDLNEKLFMEQKIENEILDFATVCDIPKGYLRGKLGLDTTNLLRNFSQGYKVCTELLTYLLDYKQIEVGQKILVVTGTVVGADTAMEFEIKTNERFKVKKILCMAIN
jgi:uncharacterized protein